MEANDIILSTILHCYTSKNYTVLFLSSEPTDIQSFRKKVREFTLNTQRELEEERAKLKSENTALKEQLRQMQKYIDNQLNRYQLFYS